MTPWTSALLQLVIDAVDWNFDMSAWNEGLTLGRVVTQGTTDARYAGLKVK